MSVQPIPEGYRTVTPYMSVRGAAAAIAFYAKAFGAVELFRLAMPDGKVAHAELQLGDSKFMLADENVEWGNLAPPTLGGTPVVMMHYVEDVDASFARAVGAGAAVKMDVMNHFYGDRSGTVIDPFGHQWMIATHVEDVDPADMQARMAGAMMA